jgi:GNAT superfamily N-acetyltransferase
MIELKKMALTDFEAFKTKSVENYAKALKRNLKIPYRQSLVIAQKESDDTLSYGYFTESHHFFTIYMKMTGQPIGFVWYHVDMKMKTAFLYDIWLEKKYRSKGLSVFIFDEIEDKLKKHNMKYFRLNVFADNTEAFQAYLKNGFTVSNSIMQKVLDEK